MHDRTLVTGGAGFVGSHLCERLLQRGERVVCLDNFSTSRPGNVAALTTHPGFELVVGDVRRPVRRRADRIYNLACAASPVHYQSDPIGTTQTCVVGAMTLLEQARRDGARILQASTSEVYGDPAVSPQPETYRGHVSTTGPRACYDEGKRCAESLFYDYHRHHGVDIRVARIFNTYGPRMQPDDGRVVSNFIVQALAGQPLTIYGDGSQTRSFCYVDDLVDGLIRLMDAETDATNPVNLGNPHEMSLVELAELIVDIVGRRLRIAFMPLPQDDPVRRRPDIARARAVLGWAPSVPIREGLSRTVAYFDELLAEGGARAALPSAAE